MYCDCGTADGFKVLPTTFSLRFKHSCRWDWTSTMLNAEQQRSVFKMYARSPGTTSDAYPRCLKSEPVVATWAESQPVQVSGWRC